jgi:ribosomal-protein-alanine N-acetyltransferase
VVFPDPWSAQQLTDAMGWPGVIAFVAEDAIGVLGYVLGRVIVDEAEILSIGTMPRSRRQGIGRALLDAALDQMIERGARGVWLEVRQSNVAACEMYRVAGFLTTGRRRGYYRQPPEDALVLHRELPADRVIAP